MPAIAPADPNRSPAFEQCLIFAIAIELQRAQTPHVHNHGTVRASEQSRVEVLFQIGQTPANKMRLRTYMQTCIVIGGLNPVDIFESDKEYLVSLLHYDSLGLTLRLKLLLCAAHDGPPRATGVARGQSKQAGPTSS